MSLFRKRFNEHRGAARQRGVEFLLTFEEWMDIWTASGHLHERGKAPGQYVMARFGDKGPYKVGNVKIITMKENIQEGSRGFGNSSRSGKPHSEETKRKMSVSSMGKPATRGMTGQKHKPETIAKLRAREFSPETRAKMSRAAILWCRRAKEARRV